MLHCRAMIELMQIRGVTMDENKASKSIIVPIFTIVEFLLVLLLVGR